MRGFFIKKKTTKKTCCLEDRQEGGKKKCERKKTLWWRLASLDLVTWPWPSSECVFDPVTHDSGCGLLLGYKSQIFLPYIQQVQIRDKGKTKNKVFALREDPDFLSFKASSKSKEVGVLFHFIDISILDRCSTWEFTAGKSSGLRAGRKRKRLRGNNAPNVVQLALNYQTVTSKTQSKIFPRMAGYALKFWKECFLLEWTQHTWIIKHRLSR